MFLKKFFPDPILNFLFRSLQEKDLFGATSITLHNLCIICSSHMTTHFQEFLKIVQNFDNYPINSETANGLLKGINNNLYFS